MGCAHSRFTVLFEGPFWIGLYEREENGLYAGGDRRVDEGRTVVFRRRVR